MSPRVDVGVRGDVGRHGERRAAALRDLRHEAIQPVPPPGGEHDEDAFRGEGARGGGADARRGSSNNGHTARKRHPAILPKIGCGRGCGSSEEKRGRSGAAT